MDVWFFGIKVFSVVVSPYASSTYAKNFFTTSLPLLYHFAWMKVWMEAYFTLFSRPRTVETSPESCLRTDKYPRPRLVFQP